MRYRGIPMITNTNHSIKTLCIEEKKQAILKKYNIDINRINTHKTILDIELRNHIGLLLYIILRHKKEFKLYLGEEHLKRYIKSVIKQYNYFEVRFLGKFKGKKQLFFDISNLNENNIHEKIEELYSTIKKQIDYILKQKNGKFEGVYVGIAPRKCERGDAKAATAWSYITFDVDIEEWKSSKMPTAEEIEEKLIGYLYKFVEYGVYPHKIAFTGGGLRFILLPERPILKEELAILKQIAEKIGADTAIYDLARVDRLIGTYNYKEKYGNPRPCITIAWLKDEEDIEKLITPILFYKKMGIVKDYNEFKELFNTLKEEYNTEIGLNNMNKTIKKLMKKTNLNITVLNDIDKKTYKWLASIQAKLNEKVGSKWVEKLLSYLGIDYKYGRNGDRLDLWSLFFDDGTHPDCSIYLNQGYNAVMVDFHDPNMRFIALAGLWMIKEFRDKIIEFLKLYNINPNPSLYRPVREVMNELLNRETIKIDAEGYIPKEAIIKAYQLSIEKNIPVFLKADTGRGKTYTITRNAVDIKERFKKSAIAVLFPYKIQVLQVGAALHADDISVPMYYEDGKRLSKNTIHYLTLGTYDQVENIFKDLCWDRIKKEDIKIREENDILLTIDEAHDLIIQKEFRKRAIGSVRKFMNKAGGCILLTATPELINLNNYPVIEVEFRDKKDLFKRKSIHVAKNPIGEFCRYILKKFGSGEVKNAVVLVDNKKIIENIKYTLKLYDFDKPIYVITRETVGIDEASKMIIEKEKVPEEGLILATRVISEGVNIKNHVDLVWALYCRSATTIRQFIARCRNGGEELIITAPERKSKNEPTIIDYNTMLKQFKENYRILKEYLETDIETLKELDKNYKKIIISEIQKAIYYDEEKKEWVLDEDELAHIYNSLLELKITRDYTLLKEYLEKTTGYRFAIKSIKELEENKLEKTLKKKHLEYLEKEDAKHTICAFKKYSIKSIKDAITYNNYKIFTKFGDEYTPQLVKRHAKRISRCINALNDIYNHPETIEVYSSMLNKEEKDKDENKIKKCIEEIYEYKKMVKEINENKEKNINYIDLKLLSENETKFKNLSEVVDKLISDVFLCPSSKWGKVNRIVRAVWNMVIGEQDENLHREKLGMKSLTTKALLKIREFTSKCKKFKIKELIEYIKKECGFVLSIEEVKRLLRSIFNCVVRGVKKSKDNALVEIKEVNEGFKKLYEILKQQNIFSNSITKCEKVIENKINENGGSIFEDELYELIVEKLKFAEEVFHKALEKLKMIGVIYEPKPGLLQIL